MSIFGMINIPPVSDILPTIFRKVPAIDHRLTKLLTQFVIRFLPKGRELIFYRRLCLAETFLSFISSKFTGVFTFNFFVVRLESSWLGNACLLVPEVCKTLFFFI